VSKKRSTPSSSRRPTQDWRSAYKSLLLEPDKGALFKCVEVAEAALLTRHAALGDSPDDQAERREIESALGHLRAVKKHQLGWE